MFKMDYCPNTLRRAGAMNNIFLINALQLENLFSVSVLNPHGLYGPIIADMVYFTDPEIVIFQLFCRIIFFPLIVSNTF